MNKSECHIGMEVFFGKGNGQQTKGKIVKLNKTTAGVKTEEDRGVRDAGTIWRVSYSLLSTNGSSCTPTLVTELVYNEYQDKMEQLVLEAIACCYDKLSPENISCDGEIPINIVMQRRKEIDKKLEGLFQALGKRVSEYAVFNWMKQKQEKTNAVNNQN